VTVPSRTDLHHYDREQVVEHLREAMAIVAELEPADDLRVPTFANAVQMLSQKQAIFEQLAPAARLLPRPLQ
jgi:hypothetical protein